MRNPDLLAAGGPLIGRRAGQRLARHELGELSVIQRIEHWFGRALGGAGIGVPRGWFGLVVLAVALVAVTGLVIILLRPGRARRPAASPVLGGVAKSARDYRQEAERHAAAGDYGAAIVDRVRAIAAELSERSIVPPRPGRTADELAREAGRELPELAGDLAAATRLFDDVHYGDKAGTRDGYGLVSELDTAVRTVRLPATAGSAAGQPGQADGAGPGPGVPR